MDEDVEVGSYRAWLESLRGGSKSKQGTLCDHCGRVIGATKSDPMVHMTAGRFHMDCLGKVEEKRRAAEEKRRVERAIARAAMALEGEEVT